MKGWLTVKSSLSQKQALNPSNAEGDANARNVRTERKNGRDGA